MRQLPSEGFYASIELLRNVLEPLVPWAELAGARVARRYPGVVRCRFAAAASTPSVALRDSGVGEESKILVRIARAFTW